MRNNKLLMKLLACACLVSSLYVPNITAQASSLTNSNLSEADLTLGQVNNNDCVVDVNVGSSYTVTLPKKITLSGSDGVGDYTVTVKGDIGARRRISVIPDETFNLQSAGKQDVITEISQPKRVFTYDELAIVDGASQLVGTTTTGNVTAGPLSKGVWSGTFNFNISSYEFSLIDVVAKDTNDTDLNAKAYTIEGQEKEDLLDALVNSGLVTGINKEGVDGLIEVESDDFDDIADTTFDVSNVMQDGDTVVILHYNEDTNEWEYIGTETVVDGKINGSFTSYSPVAFVKVNTDGSLDIPDAPDNSGDGNTEESPASYFTTDGAGTITGLTDEGKAAIELITPREIDGVQIIAIGNDAFKGDNVVNSIIISEGVTSIGDYTFAGCTALSEISLPNSLNSLGECAFNICSGLETIIIPDSVTLLGEVAFRNCTGLKEVTLSSNLTAIKGSTFIGCTELIKVTIPEGIISIGSNAFDGCVKLEEVYIPNTVKTIGDSAFSRCTKLALVDIEDNSGITRSFGKYAFSNCSALVEISVPEGVTSIGNYAFKDCTNLESVELSNSVTTVGEYAFTGCTALKDINIPNTCWNIKKYAFNGCTGLTEITIPCGSIIDNGVFNDCTGLTNVIISYSVSTISKNAFKGCTALNTVNYMGSEDQWNSILISSTGNDAVINATKVYNYTP